MSFEESEKCIQVVISVVNTKVNKEQLLCVALTTVSYFEPSEREKESVVGCLLLVGGCCARG